MSFLLWMIIGLVVNLFLLSLNLDFIIYTAALAVFLLIVSFISNISVFALIFSWLVFIASAIVLNYAPYRQKFITAKLFVHFKKFVPKFSNLEKKLLATGDDWWNAELFNGNPNWQLISTQELNYAKLTSAEQNFLTNEVNQLLHLIDNWQLNYVSADISKEIWQFLQKNGFFGLLIPHKYQGKQFSIYAYSQIISKIASKNAAISILTAIANSLGPAKLLLAYGTDEQKDLYLPQLATGQEIPCFALTSANAGTDIASITDFGIICEQEVHNAKVLGIKLNFAKRYVTLAPKASLICLVFKLYDPNNLLNLNKKNVGITCALVNKNVTGISIDKKHISLVKAMVTGPISGKEVFIPLNNVIGGKQKIGHGLRMIKDCLANDKGISLPASAIGGIKSSVLISGVYARVRNQFKRSIVEFDGVAEVLARATGLLYISDAMRFFTATAMNNSIHSNICAEITKYNATEFCRQACLDLTDIMGGKAICLGEKNYIFQYLQALPIFITVADSNIITRNRIIFGHGLIKSHPHLFSAIKYLEEDDLHNFDQISCQYVSHFLANAVRSLWCNLSHSYFVKIHAKNKTKKYYQLINGYSATFATAADFALLVLGNRLKKREYLSSRLADMLSCLYAATAVLKYYEYQEENSEIIDVIHWSCQYLFNKFERSLNDFIQNFPHFWGRIILRTVCSLRHNARYPSMHLHKKLGDLISKPSLLRKLWLQSIQTDAKNDFAVQTDEVLAEFSTMQQLMLKIEQQLLTKNSFDKLMNTQEKIEFACQQKIIDKKQAIKLQKYWQYVLDNILAVDEFESKQ